MTMEERVDRLERRNRQLLVAIAAMVGVGVLAVFVAGRMATAQASVETVEEVRTKKLVVVDDLGKVRAALAVTGDGPALLLLDTKSKPRATLSVFKDAPGFILRDANGEARAMLAVIGDGPGLVLYDARGRKSWGSPSP